MASVNKVIIVGNLGADPDVKTFDNGGKIANISVATTDRWTDRNTGEQREATEWHRITFNDRLADIVAQYLRKGSQVYVEGSLKTRKWQDPQTGQDRYTTEIRATSMQMLGSRPSGGDNYQNQHYQNNPQNGGYNQGYQNNGGYQNHNPQNWQNNQYNNAPPQAPNQWQGNPAPQNYPQNNPYDNYTPPVPMGQPMSSPAQSPMPVPAPAPMPAMTAPQGNQFGSPEVKQSAPADDDMPF